VGGTAKHCINQYMVWSLLVIRGRHYYAGRPAGYTLGSATHF